MRQAYENLDRLQALHAGAVTRSWVAQWQALLDQGPGAALEVLTSRTERACELRQNSPFAGVVSPEQRAAVLRAFVAEWNAGQKVSG